MGNGSVQRVSKHSLDIVKPPTQQIAKEPPRIESLRNGAVKLFEVGATLTGNITLLELEAVTDDFIHLRESLSFIIGDLINQGAARYGEKYAVMREKTNWSYNSLRKLASVCRGIPKRYRRLDFITFSHHSVVSKFRAPKPGEPYKWSESPHVLIPRWLMIANGELQAYGDDAGMPYLDYEPLLKVDALPADPTEDQIEKYEEQLEAYRHHKAAQLAIQGERALNRDQLSELIKEWETSLNTLSILTPEISKPTRDDLSTDSDTDIVEDIREPESTGEGGDSSDDTLQDESPTPKLKPEYHTSYFTSEVSANLLPRNIQRMFGVGVNGRTSGGRVRITYEWIEESES